MAIWERESIRIGTMVKAAQDPAAYIKAILPHGFESINLTFPGRVDMDLGELADTVLGAVEGTGVVVSALEIFGNPLQDGEVAEATAVGWKVLIEAAGRFGCDIVSGFTGRIENLSIPENIPRFKEVFTPLADLAAKRNVRLAFENCTKGGNWQAGPLNIAHNPQAWELMFEAIPGKHVGLEWEPDHQLTQLIDPVPQLREWAPKVFHVHGKDATIMWDVVRSKGIAGPDAYLLHRTPGFGETDWREVITILRMAGSVGAIDVEGGHDPAYKEELEMMGQVHALDYLKRCRGGAFVPNPSLSTPR